MHTARDLRRDQRGAIVVVAVFMAAFLCGVLWYMIGIGDAIVYRQQMQAGADATAFGSAVYHARGMNMIAMINLNMAALIAILVAAKTLKMLIGIVYVGAVTACTIAKNADPPKDDGCAEAGYAAKQLEKLMSIIGTIEQKGDGTLKNLSDSQVEIARVTPWIAFTRSNSVDAKNYAPSVIAGAATSVSMVPADKRLGLPVEEEEFKKVCERGRLVVNDLITASIPPMFNVFLGGFMGNLLGFEQSGSYPAKYCEGGNGGLHLRPEFDQRKLCRDTLPRAEGESEQDWHDRIDDCVDHPPSDSEIQANNDANNIPNVDPEDGVDEPPVEPEDKTTKQIFEPAHNGDDYFQVYSLVRGATSRLGKSDEGVEISSWQKAMVAAPDPLEGVAVAQAEFYYDQIPNMPQTFPECWTPPCGTNWPTYRENVMWNMRWRARLRRYRAPTGIDINVIESGVSPPEGVIQAYQGGSVEQIGMPGGSAVLGAGKTIIH